MKIISFEELGSTNDQATRGGYTDRTIIVTANQTAGRGQRGNSWASQSGQNLTFSLVIEPRHIPVVEQYRISMVAALSASDALREAGVECIIKWSNDLYVGDSKIGGILIEHSLMGEMLTRTVIGIGINVHQSQFPSDLPNPTSLVNEGVRGVSPSDLLDMFIVNFENRYAQSVEVLHGDYMDRLWRKTGEHKFCDAGGEFRANIHGVDPLTGLLTLELEGGARREYWFKEVEFK